MQINTFEEILDKDGAFLFKSVGASMQPLIKEGRDYIYIQKSYERKLEKYDVVLFQRPEILGRGRYVLHRILKMNSDGTYWIVGDNCTSGEVVEEDNILGVLTTLKRKGKIVNVSDFGYKLYTYIWCAPWPIRFFFLRQLNLVKRIIGKGLRILHLQ